jgi:hypothetical protein
MDRTRARDPSDQPQGILLFFVGLIRQTNDEIDHRDDPPVGTGLDCCYDILHGMSTTEPVENRITPRLGTKVKTGICAIFRDEIDRFFPYKFRSYFTRKRAKIDLVPDTAEQSFDPIEPGMNAII